MGQRTLAFTRLLLKEVSCNTFRNLVPLVVSGRRSGGLGAKSGDPGDRHGGWIQIFQTCASTKNKVWAQHDANIHISPRF
jgi:hypothetical protein